MVEVRFHGRGGQGSVIASTILALAAFKEGKDIQAFPFFGVERRGAPVTAFTRIAEDKITKRTAVYQPNYVIILDPALISGVDVTKGLQSGGLILVNSHRGPAQFHFGAAHKVATINAVDIALRHGLGVKATPIVNTAILGAFAKVVNIVSLESILAAIREKITSKTEANVAAAEEAFAKVIV